MKGQPFSGKHIFPFYYSQLDSNQGNFFGLGSPIVYDGKYGMLPQHFDTFKKLRHNRIEAFPPRSRIYVPKHVTLPRAKLRAFARKSDSTITQKLESASCMIVDFFWLYNMGHTWDSYYGDQKTPMYYNVTDSQGKDHFLTERAWESIELTFPNDFTLTDPIRALGSGRKSEVEAMEHLIECLEERPDIPVVSYDNVNDNLANNPLDSMDQPIKMIRMVMNTTDLNTAMLSLEFISNLHPNKDRILVWSLVICMHALQKTGDFRNRFTSVLHYNVMERFLQKVGYIHLDNSCPTKSTQYADTFCETGREDAELSMARAIRQVITILNVNGNSKPKPKAPMWMAKWWIEYTLTEYLSNHKDVFDSTTTSKKDKVLKAAYAMTDTGSKSGVDVFSEVLDLDIFTLLHYLVENYEQTKQRSWSPVGEDMCQKAKTPLSIYSK